MAYSLFLSSMPITSLRRTLFCSFIILAKLFSTLIYIVFLISLVAYSTHLSVLLFLSAHRRRYTLGEVIADG